MSSNEIDAAVNGHGFVLGQVSMMEEELRAGTLVIPLGMRIPLRESYYLAWNRSAFEKPYGREFRSWIMALAKKQATASSVHDARG